MQVYSYDPSSLEFDGFAEAHESPLEPGVFHIPANATDVQLPAFDPATQTCRFYNGNWVVGVRTSTELPIEPTLEEVTAALALDLRTARDANLRDTDWIVLRQQEEVMLGRTPTIPAEQWQSLLVYRQALRDLPEQPGFPRVQLPDYPAI